MDSEITAFLPETLVIGVPEIDVQHADVLARVFYLKECCIESNGFPTEDAKALVNALRVHFETEERLASEVGLDFLAHADGHNVLLYQVAMAINNVRNGRMDAFSFIRYLDYWFERHIHDEDVPLGSHLDVI